MRNDVRQRGFPKSGRTGKKDVVEGFSPGSSCFEEDAQIISNLFLANELVERLRAQLSLDVFVRTKRIWIQC